MWVRVRSSNMDQYGFSLEKVGKFRIHIQIDQIGRSAEFHQEFSLKFEKLLGRAAADSKVYIGFSSDATFGNGAEHVYLAASSALENRYPTRNILPDIFRHRPQCSCFCHAHSFVKGRNRIWQIRRGDPQRR